MDNKEKETNVSKSDNKNNGRNKRSRRNKSPRRKAEFTSGHQKAYNDPQWYAKTPQLLKDAASYPFNVATGNSLNMSTLAGYSSTTGDRASGIMTVEVIPHLGISTKATDPVNVAATAMLSYIVHANSRNLRYGRADLMLAIGAADSFFSFINWCQRLYGIARNPRQWNRYTAAALVRANGVNFSDLLANLNDFRSWLNQLIIKGSAIWVPNTLPVMKKHAWMFSNVYRDDQNEQSQMYMFIPSLFYKYDETGSEQGGQLIPQWISNTSVEESKGGIVKDSDLLTFAQIKTLGNSLIQAILDSEDIQVIFGDILKAYGENSLFKLVTIDESYSIEAVYNEEVLLEVANSFSAPRATVYGDVDAEYSIKQDVNNQIITFSPSLYTKYAGYELNKLINFNWDSVSPESLMVATRLVPSLTIPKAEGPWFKYEILSAGTELVTGYRIYSMTKQDGKILLLKTKRFDSVLYTSEEQSELQYRASSSKEIIDLVTKLAHFDWHPTIYCISTPTNFGTPSGAKLPAEIVLDGVIADVCNANSIAYKDLINLDYTALLSEFDVPV